MKPEDQAAASSGSFKFLGIRSCLKTMWGMCISLFCVYAKAILLTYLRLVFPTIAENASAVAVLPNFIEVCGRKIDNTTQVLDWFSFVYFMV